MSRPPKAVEEDPAERFNLNIRRMEPFLDHSGEYGFAYIWDNGRVEVKTISEWAEHYSATLGKVLEERISQFNSIGFLIPGYPEHWDYEVADRSLMFDIIETCSEYVNLESSEWEFALASWILYAWIPEQFSVLPRLLVNGATNTGKSRVLDLIRLIGNKGLASTDMSPAVMYRIAEQYQPTLSYDEAQDMVGDKDKKAAIFNIFKAGYDRRPVLRMNESNEGIDVFRVENPLAMAVKNYDPPEDVLNRSLIFNMVKNRRPVSKERPVENEVFQEFRGRALAFRLQSMSGKIPIDEFKLKATELVDKEIELDGRKYQLEDRAAELARVLIIPSLVFGGSDEVLRILLESEIKARQALLMTREASVFYALQADLNRHIKEGRWKWIPNGGNPNEMTLAPSQQVGEIFTYSKDILDFYIEDLRQQGDLDEKKLPTSAPITRALKSLGFKGRPGTSNKFGLLTKDFPERYLANLERYGERSRES